MKLYSSISVPLCTLKSDTRFCFALYHSHALWDCQHILWVFLVFICFSCFFVLFCGFISLCPPNIYFINPGQRTKKHHSGVRSDVFLLYMISNNLCQYYASNFFTSILALCPPNPSELLSAYVISLCTPSPMV